MKWFVAFVVIAGGGAVCSAADLPRSAPEEQGVSSSAVQAFVETADQKLESLNSFMMLRHGHVVAEGWWAPYRADVPHMLYSLSKSFTSTAVGIAAAEGKLSVDDPVLKFFPDDAPNEPGDNLKRMRVSDLLRMSTGHQTEPPRSTDISWVKAFLAHPVPFKPGTHFLYNTQATYMQSAVVQKATGMTLIDYLRPRLFEPLGIENPTWEVSPQGISTGGYGLKVRTEDIARFGQLYLQKGMWEGKRLVPESWIEAATALQTSNGSDPASDWDQGYGYQFWRCRHGGYRGDGAFGQYCIVLPEQDAVIAITSGLGDMQAVLNIVWDKLLPAMKSGKLPADEKSHQAMVRTLKGLSLRPQEGTSAGMKLTGKKYKFPANPRGIETIEVRSREKEGDVSVVMTVSGVEHRIDCGRNQWTGGRSAWGMWGDIGWGPVHEQGIAASCGWTSAENLAVKICFYETPFTVSFKFKFSGNLVEFQAKPNLGFAPKNEIELVGIANE